MPPSVQKTNAQQKRSSATDPQGIDEMWKKIVDVGIVFDRKIGALAARVDALQDRSAPPLPLTESNAEVAGAAAAGPEADAEKVSPCTCRKKRRDRTEASIFMDGLVTGIAVGGLIAIAAYLRVMSRRSCYMRL